ncbi:hypothetical protein MPSEU_000252300 [Mayamaea pseudoterrestris]|nr:hypothetical protein MPSEU_000252300 [Mayamaea pseudoterrestris]
MQLANYFLIVLCIFAMLTLFLNGKLDPTILAATTGASNLAAPAAALDGFLQSSSSKSNKNQLAGLSCRKYGGPPDAEAKEMVYWRDIPADSQHLSPFRRNGGSVQYLTFEPDFGGWNNIRMGMETVVALAFAMGRTLVLPPESKMYLIGAQKNGQRNKFSFSHFFHMQAIHEEHPGIDIISMDEFIRREALAGRFRDDNGKILLPPGTNRTNFDGEPEVIYPYLRQVGIVAKWDPDTCMAAFPSSTSKEDMAHILELNATVQTEGLPIWEDYVGKPIPVDSSSMERMKEMRAGRRQLCIYDQTMQDSTLVHFAAIQNEPGGRLLVHFYAFLFFQDWHHDLWLKRFMRDHMRYIDEIQCAAARLVTAIRKRARERNATNSEGLFDTMHIRRGDFQYKMTRVDADAIYSVTKRTFAEGATVYIATDERDKSFFKVLSDHYNTVFMDDLLAELGDVNTNYYGMIDQLVASRGRYFFGCWFSTFTGFINRMRGYHATQDKYLGHENGIIPSWYYVMEDRFDQMQSFVPVKQSFWAREFPTSWRNLETGIDIFHKALGHRKASS